MPVSFTIRELTMNFQLTKTLSQFACLTPTLYWQDGQKKVLFGTPVLNQWNSRPYCVTSTGSTFCLLTIENSLRRTTRILTDLPSFSKTPCSSLNTATTCAFISPPALR